MHEIDKPTDPAQGPENLIAPTSEAEIVSLKSDEPKTEVPLGKPDTEPIVQAFSLDTAERIKASTFPHQPLTGSTVIPTTIPNVGHLLKFYNVLPRYNVVKKRLTIQLPPGHYGTSDNADNIAIAQILSLAALNGLAIGQVPAYVEAIGDRNQYCPVSSWIMSRPWDGVDRMPDFYATLEQRDDFPENLKQILMKKWMLSGVAAVLKPSGFRCRGVLTLQGPQSIGKTEWPKSLVPDEILRENVIKVDHHLDAGNKDTILTAIEHWIVEIGELDSSFKKDVARLKGFLTADRDKVRRPYARTDSAYPRRTIFCASVNDDQFLPDMTGNSRWWTIPVVKVNYAHGLDMQQVFAQLAVEYRAGAIWWLAQDEEIMLEALNKDYRVVSVIRERVLAYIDPAKANEDKLPAMTATELLREIGIDHPTNPQAKECAATLKEMLGLPKKIQGQYRWRIPRADDTMTL